MTRCKAGDEVRSNAAEQFAKYLVATLIDATETRELGFLEFLVHVLNYTPVGYIWQA